VAEDKIVSATINSVAITQTATVVVTAGTVSAGQSEVAATSPITAGSGTSTITVTARDAGGNPIAGATVVLAATGTGNTLTQPSGTTNASGVATGTLSSTVAEDKTVSATIDGTAVSQTATITVTPGSVSASESALTAEPTSISAGTGSSTITVTARDAHGNPIAGAAVVLSASGTGNVLTQPGGPTNASGVATGTLSSVVAEPKTVSGTIDGVAITQTATVTVTTGVGSATQSSVTASPASIPASSGASVSTITVTVRDAFDNPVVGATVTLASPDPGTKFTQPSGKTDSNGQIAGTMSSTLVGTKTVTATVNTTVLINGTATVDVDPGPPATLSFARQPSDAETGAIIAPAVVVAAQDEFGNTATAFTGSIALAITPGSGTPLAVLSGTNPVNAIGGLATFVDLSINLPSTLIPYRLDATSTALTDATSSSFNVTGLPIP